MNGLYSDTPQQRIERHSIPEPNSGCWLWLMSVNAKGYAHLRWKQVMMRANRFSWQAYRGPIPEGLHVLHHCDNRLCVNPDHLFLGTNQENVDDRVRKERSARFVGEAHPRAKLTELDVLFIRQSKRTGPELAQVYGVSVSLINHIKTRLIWKHI